MEKYRKFVRRLIDHQTTFVDNDLMHMLLGIVGEAGEIANCIKHVVGYNQELDEENLIEELGDLIFYAVGMMDILGVDIDQVISKNMKKLKKRYPIGYSDWDALDRKDKKC